jgi:hypothetical protein
MLLYHPNPYWIFSDCKGVAVTEDNKVVSIGTYYSALTGDYSALITLSDD